MSNVYQWRHSMGVCVQCRKQDAYTMAGRWRCAECAAQQAAVMRERRRADPDHYKQISMRYQDSHIRAGLCRECSKPAAEGKTYCNEHLLAVRRRSQERRDRDKPEGRITDQPDRCRRCGEPAAPGYQHCETHHRQIAEHLRKIRKTTENGGHPWRRSDRLTFLT